MSVSVSELETLTFVISFVGKNGRLTLQVFICCMGSYEVVGGLVVVSSFSLSLALSSGTGTVAHCVVEGRSLSLQFKLKSWGLKVSRRY